MPPFECHHCLRHAPVKYVSKKEFPLSIDIGIRSRCWGEKKLVNRNQEMKVLLTIWISAVLIQEVVPSVLVRHPRQASNASSFLHTEYEAKIEQKGKHGNESFGTMSGKQAIEHDNCNDNWNAFANKCAALIKDLVASLANSVSSKPGDATNLQLHIKNTFRHLDNTHNCSCLNHTGKGLSDMDLSHIFDNLTLSTTGPEGDDDDDDDEGNSDDDNEEPSSIPGANRYPNRLTSGTNVNPENEEDPNSTINSRRQAKHEPYSSGTSKSNDISDSPAVAQKPQGRKGALHPFLTTPLPSPERSHSASNANPTTPPLHYTKEHSSPESSSVKISPSPYGSDDSLGNSHHPEIDPISEAPTQTEQPLIVTFGKNQKPIKKTKDSAVAAEIPIPKESHTSQSATPEDFSTPKRDYDYDEPTSGSVEHMTSARPKHNDRSSYSYESPDYDSSTEASKSPVSVPVKGSKDKRPVIIPVTNTDSNVPESSEPKTTHDSLSSGMSPTSSDEKSYAEDPLSHSLGSTHDSEQTTPACDETSGAETVTIPITLESESEHETGEEVLITPRPIAGAQEPVAENQTLSEKSPEESEITDSAVDNENPLTESSASALPAEEELNTASQSVHPTEEQAVSEAPVSSHESHAYGTTVVTTEKDDEEVEHSTVAVVPVTSSKTHDHDSEENEHEEHTTVTISAVSPVEERTEKEEENEDHTEVSENPVLVQPTTFQTTSEDPTHSPVKLIPVTVASTAQDSDEGTTSENKHEKHHHHHRHNDDDEEDEDDCCSCESCTEEEESDPRKVKENVCKSLEEARKELKSIFDKIKKKLRCCRKMPHTITTNTSPLPQ